MSPGIRRARQLTGRMQRLGGPFGGQLHLAQQRRELRGVGGEFDAATPFALRNGPARQLVRRRCRGFQGKRHARRRCRDERACSAPGCVPPWRRSSMLSASSPFGGQQRAATRRAPPARAQDPAIRSALRARSDDSGAAQFARHALHFETARWWRRHAPARASQMSRPSTVEVANAIGIDAQLRAHRQRACAGLSKGAGKPALDPGEIAARAQPASCRLRRRAARCQSRRAGR